VAGEGGLNLVRKSVKVLDLLAERGEATAAELADDLNEPRSSVYRLLASLQTLDMVEQGPRKGRYRLGIRLVRLGSAVIERFDERNSALPVMERLHAETGETVFLCVRRDMEAVCIERLAGRRVQSLALKLGGALPLHAGAAPRALLAFEDRGLWARYLAEREPLEGMTPSTPVTTDALVAVLEEVRRTGVSISDQDVTIGIAALGVPVLDYQGHVRAALSISGVREAVLGEDADRVRRLLVEGGREISHALGWREPNGQTSALT
jgi:DNA-binding IclR family transcriptional regulator